MNEALEGPPILAAIKASGVEVVVSVPDIVTSEGLLRPISTDPDLRHVRVCKEDEGVSICAALSYCGVHEFSDLDALADALPGILTAPGPTFVDLKVVPGGRYEYRWDVVHGEKSRAVFSEAMQGVLAARERP